MEPNCATHHILIRFQSIVYSLNKKRSNLKMKTVENQGKRFIGLCKLKIGAMIKGVVFPCHMLTIKPLGHWAKFVNGKWDALA